MNTDKSMNPILAELKIVKNKLEIQSKIIQLLTNQMQVQRQTLLSIVAQFEQHEYKVMRKLQKLEQINIKYIKNYLQLKGDMQIEDFSSSYLQINAQRYKKQRQALIDKTMKNPILNNNQNQKLIEKCCHLIKDYLSNRKIDYGLKLNKLTEERRERLKQLKGLDAYKLNKQQAKFIEKLKDKIERFNSNGSETSMDNLLRVFYQRTQIEKDLCRLNPQRSQLTLEESLAQQQTFKQIIGEIVLNSSSENINQVENLLEGSFKYIQNKLIQLSEQFGADFLQKSLQFIKNNGQDKTNTFNKIIRNRQNYQQQSMSNKLNKQQQPNKKRQERQSQEDKSQTMQQFQTLRYTRKSRQQKPSTLNSKLQSEMTKTFFQQQQKSRDLLINKQVTQIQQNKKVINKLITFIKKQFKDSTLDDIDGDDPQQLIGYYFKVNQKKYVEVKQEIDVLQVEHKKMEKLNEKLMQQTVELTEQRAKLFEQMLMFEVENQQLRRKLQEQQKNNISQLKNKYQEFKSSTFELHILNNKTQDIVKLSLQILFNSFMNKISAECMIDQLERIISMIKENINQKNDISCILTIYQLNKDQKDRGQQCILERSGKQVEEFKQQKDFEAKDQSLVKQINQIQGEQSTQRNKDENQQKNSYDNIKKQQNFAQNVSKYRESPKQDNIKTFGFDQNYIKNISQKILKIKDNFNSTNDQIDIKEMYSKYKQALDCLQRAQKLNKQHQMKYQQFVDSLKRKGVWDSPQKIEQKLFYMDSLIKQQDELLQNQRKEFEEIITKQVQQSQMLSQSILRKLKIDNKAN